MLTVLTVLFEIIAHIIMFAAKSIILAAKVTVKTGKVAGKVAIKTGKVAAKAGKVAGKVATTAGKAAIAAGKVAKVGVKTAQKGANAVKKGAKKTADVVKSVSSESDMTAEEQIKKHLTKSAQTVGKAAGIAASLATKGAIIAVKLLFTFLRIMTKVIALLYLLACSMMAMCGLFLIASFAIIVLWFHNFGLGFGVGGSETVVSGLANQVMTFDYQGAIGIIGDETIVGSNYTGAVVQNGDYSYQQGNPKSCLDALGNWYVNNITSYQREGRGTYQCTLVPTNLDGTGGTCVDDCSGFACSYMSMVAGTFCGMTYTGGLISESGVMQVFVNNGWHLYTPSQIGGAAGLKAGDVVIYRNFETEKGHAECIVDVHLNSSDGTIGVDTFGWGQRQSSYPSRPNRTVVTKTDSSGNATGIAFSNDSRVYKYIWRYVG